MPQPLNSSPSVFDSQHPWAYRQFTAGPFLDREPLEYNQGALMRLGAESLHAHTDLSSAVQESLAKLPKHS